MREPGGLDRAVRLLYLGSILALPWSLLPLPLSPHPRAQWSDVLFGLAAVLWCAGRAREPWARQRPRAVSLAALGYVAAAAASLAFAPAPGPAAAAKVVGIAELALLLLVTSSLVRSGALPAIARCVAGSALAVAAAAVAGVAAAMAGAPTILVGGYGDLQPGPYARAQAGFPHPNLMASWCIFAAAVMAHPGARLPAWLRHGAQAATALAVALAFSRTIAAFACAAVVRGARDAAGRRRAWLAVAATASFMVALTALHVRIDPTSPLEAGLEAGPSPRLQSVRTAWQTLLAHPLTGLGPESRPARVAGHPFDAHLTPLDVAATLGLPALLFLAALVTALWRSRARPTELATWAGLAAIGLEALASDVQDFRHVWILMGVADGTLLASRTGASEHASHEERPGR